MREKPDTFKTCLAGLISDVSCLSYDLTDLSTFQLLCLLSDMNLLKKDAMSYGLMALCTLYKAIRHI
jgi:hypothetical protein